MHGFVLRPLNPLLDLPCQKCTLSCPILDRLLAGGVPCGSITEIVAESGVGKTQLCLQLLLSAFLPQSQGGLSSASLYIHSECPFPLRRLHSLFLSSHSNSSPLDHILVRGVHSADELVAILDRLEGLLSHPPTKLPIKLIIIDSIAALFRSDFDNNPADLKRRSSLFFRIAGKLKDHARRFGLAVVVTNQVVDVVVSDDGANGVRVGNYAALSSSGRRVCPALGLSWANCVNTRLFLSRSEERVEEGKTVAAEEEGEEVVVEEGSYRTRRKMMVVFAPHLPASSCEFVITREGVFGVR